MPYAAKKVVPSFPKNNCLTSEEKKKMIDAKMATAGIF
jgi:hypothetical protein